VDSIQNAVASVLLLGLAYAFLKKYPRDTLY